MGQAKRRGSLEERVALAKEKQAEFLRKSREEWERRRTEERNTPATTRPDKPMPLSVALTMAAAFAYYPSPATYMPDFGPPRRKGGWR